MSTLSHHAFQAAMADFAPALPLAVAYSGGADSTALLLACAQLWPGQVQAIHIHHGLQVAADDFARHCQQFCNQLAVPLQLVRVDARPAPGESPEDAARQARYQAFGQAVKTRPTIQAIALAQHADDQVETLLLALTRGAGLAGLAAMPVAWQRDGVQYYRPLLKLPRATLRTWLIEQTIAWIEDPTNENQHLTRNRIRAQLLPALEAAFPSFRETFSRSSTHAAHANALLLEIAAQDLAVVGTPPSIKALQNLSTHRQANVLRHWLRTVHNTTPSTVQLDELLKQIKSCTTRGQQLDIKVGRGKVLRTQDEPKDQLDFQ